MLIYIVLFLFTFGMGSYVQWMINRDKIRRLVFEHMELQGAHMILQLQLNGLNSPSRLSTAMTSDLRKQFYNSLSPETRRNLHASSDDFDELEGVPV